MIFDPSKIDLDSIATFELQENSLHSVLMTLSKKKNTGRLTLTNQFGKNHLYFMRGNPVGVYLTKLQFPLGELLLEQGVISAKNYLEAQKYIVQEKRLPGQVFKEMGVLDDEKLSSILTLQNQRKAESFCRIQTGSAEFAHGLSFLSGFQSTSLYIDSLLFFALRFSMKDIDINSYIAENEQHYILLSADSGWTKTPTSSYGLHPKEESISRKLQRRKRRVGRLFEKCSNPLQLIELLEHLKLTNQLEIIEEKKNAEFQGLKNEALDKPKRKIRAFLADTPRPIPVEMMVQDRHSSDRGEHNSSMPNVRNAKLKGKSRYPQNQVSMMVDDSEG